MRNKLNDLDAKTWLKFQKSWFIHNPPPRKKGVLTHPAKFPETMAQEFRSRSTSEFFRSSTVWTIAFRANVKVPASASQS